MCRGGRSRGRGAGRRGGGVLATTGTLRVVLRSIHSGQSPQETPERALVPKPPPLGAHGEVQCAGVPCGRSAVFGVGWGGGGGWRAQLVPAHARDGLVRPEAVALRRASRTPIGRARHRGYGREGCTPPGPTAAARPHATRELQDPPAARTASPHVVRDVGVCAATAPLRRRAGGVGALSVARAAPAGSVRGWASPPVELLSRPPLVHAARLGGDQ